MSLAIYNFILFVYFSAIKLAALFHPKAKLFIEGRKQLFNKLGAQLKLEKRERIWLHCASLGEFEQGRPVLEFIRENYPNYALVLTFFSPSGYEIRKNFEGADYVFYLPTDSAKNANLFLQIVNPKLSLFVKYEFWYHYLNGLKKRNIPTMLFSANFRAKQIFFNSYGGFFLKLLNFYEHIFVQNEESEKLLKQHNINQVTIAGDTRYDRVSKALETVKAFPNVKAFKNGQQLFIVGSSWKEDELFLKKIIEDKSFADFKLLIVPHETQPQNIDRVLKFFHPNCCLWNDSEEILSQKNIAVVNTVGHLSYLYNYADACWVGGAFGKGLHNILEPAVYGIPIFFGDRIKRFPEAGDLIHAEAAVSFSNDEQGKLTELLKDKKQLLKMGNNAAKFVAAHRGATAIITTYLSAKYLETRS